MSVVRTDNGDATVLTVEGVLDAVTAPDARPIVEQVLTDRRMNVTVDVSNLRIIDSSGVGVIVSLFKRAKSYGGVVRVSGLKNQPLTIFKLLRLDRVLVA